MDIVAWAGRMTGSIPAEYRSPTPECIRRLVQEAGDRPPAELLRMLLAVAAEIEGAEHEFAELVEQKRARQLKLEHVQPYLRAALTTYPPR